MLKIGIIDSGLPATCGFPVFAAQDFIPTLQTQ